MSIYNSKLREQIKVTEDPPIEILQYITDLSFTNVDDSTQELPLADMMYTYFKEHPELPNKLYSKQALPAATGKRSGMYHPTELVNCLRAAYYLRRGVPQKDIHSAQTGVYFGFGTLIHIFLENIFQEIFKDIKVEVPFSGDILHIAGTSDAVLPDRILEIKTIKDTPTLPSISHIAQVTLGQFVLKKPFWTILYFIKSNSKFVSFSGKFNKILWSNMADNLYLLENYFSTKGIPPERESTFMCKECSWRYTCKNIGGKP